MCFFCVLTHLDQVDETQQHALEYDDGLLDRARESQLYLWEVVPLAFCREVGRPSCRSRSSRSCSFGPCQRSRRQAQGEGGELRNCSTTN